MLFALDFAHRRFGLGLLQDTLKLDVACGMGVVRENQLPGTYTGNKNTTAVKCSSGSVDGILDLYKSWTRGLNIALASFH